MPCLTPRTPTHGAGGPIGGETSTPHSIWSTTLKNRLPILVIALSLSSPLLASAQSNQGLTREQVRAEMIQYAQAGYNPARQNPRSWVEDAQAATRQVMTAQNLANAPQLAATSASNKCD